MGRFVTPRTRKQRAVYDVLVKNERPLTVWGVTSCVYDDMRRPSGAIRHRLNALVRRGDARRLPGRPARYEAIQGAADG